MARQYPEELHIGKKVFVRVDPTGHPIAALVTKIDRQHGIVHVNPIGYKTRLATKPRAISTMTGQFLRYDNQHFYFSDRLGA